MGLLFIISGVLGTVGLFGHLIGQSSWELSWFCSLRASQELGGNNFVHCRMNLFMLSLFLLLVFKYLYSMSWGGCLILCNYIYFILPNNTSFSIKKKKKQGTCGYGVPPKYKLQSEENIRNVYIILCRKRMPLIKKKPRVWSHWSLILPKGEQIPSNIWHIWSFVHVNKLFFSSEVWISILSWNESKKTQNYLFNHKDFAD